MRKLFIVLILSICTVSCSSDSSNSENQNSGLKVAKLISKDYNGGVLESEETSIFNYENNRLSKIETTSTDNNLTEIVEFTYENDKLKKIYAYDYSSINGITSPSTEIFNYTNDLITSDTNNENGMNFSDILTYDSNGKLNNKKEFRNGNLNQETNYLYHPDGNLYKRIDLDTPTNYETVYHTYDNMKNPYQLLFTTAYLKKIAVTQNNILSYNDRTIEYTYNANNYPTMSIEKIGGETKKVTIIEYN